MKFTDFSTPRFLLEQAENQIETDLKVIEKELDTAAKTDASLVIKTKGLIQAMINKASSILNKVHHDKHESGNLVSDPITEDVATYTLIEELNNKIQMICDEVPNCDPIVGAFRDTIAKLRVTVDGAFEKTKAEGRAAAEADAVKFMNAIDAQLARLAQKIDGFVIPNYKDAGFTKNEISKMKTREKTQNTLMDLFDTLFRRKIKTGELKQEEALEFARAAADGQVINMINLVRAEGGHGSIDDYVNPTHKGVYNIIINDLLNSMPAGTGGNVGPGELALAALGDPTEKAQEKGDLIIDGQGYEIKGGNYKKGTAPTGGRLNGTQIQPGKAAHAGVTRLLRKEHNKLWKVMNQLHRKGDLKGKSIVSGITKSGTDNYQRSLNAAGYSKNDSVQFLHDLIQELVSNYKEVRGSRTDQYYENLIDAAVNQTPEGVTLSYEGLMKAITFIQHESYKTTDGFDHIMLINKSTRTFTIISSGEDFVDKISSGTVLPAKGLSITATDPQTATFHWTTK